MTPALVQELRQWFNDLIDALDAEGVCTSRECMCDTSAPIVKMNATITKLEQKLSISIPIEVHEHPMDSFQDTLRRDLGF